MLGFEIDLPANRLSSGWRKRATGLVDFGLRRRGAAPSGEPALEVQRVFLVDPDPAAFARLLAECRPDVQDLAASLIRRQLQYQPDVFLCQRVAVVAGPSSQPCS